MIEQMMEVVRQKSYVILPKPGDPWYVVRKFGPGMTSETLCRFSDIDKAFSVMKRFIACNPDGKYEPKGDNWPLGTAWVSKRLGISIFLMEDVARNTGVPEPSMHELLAMTREPHASVFAFGMDHMFKGTATAVDEVVVPPASSDDYARLAKLAVKSKKA